MNAIEKQALVATLICNAFGKAAGKGIVIDTLFDYQTLAKDIVTELDKSADPFHAILSTIHKPEERSPNWLGTGLENQGGREVPLEFESLPLRHIEVVPDKKVNKVEDTDPDSDHYSESHFPGLSIHDKLDSLREYVNKTQAVKNKRMYGSRGYGGGGGGGLIKGDYI